MWNWRQLIGRSRKKGMLKTRVQRRETKGRRIRHRKERKR